MALSRLSPSKRRKEEKKELGLIQSSGLERRGAKNSANYSKKFQTCCSGGDDDEDDEDDDDDGAHERRRRALTVVVGVVARPPFRWRRGRTGQQCDDPCGWSAEDICRITPPIHVTYGTR